MRSLFIDKEKIEKILVDQRNVEFGPVYISQEIFVDIYDEYDLLSLEYKYSKIRLKNNGKSYTRKIKNAFRAQKIYSAFMGISDFNRDIHIKEVDVCRDFREYEISITMRQYEFNNNLLFQNLDHFKQSLYKLDILPVYYEDEIYVSDELKITDENSKDTEDIHKYLHTVSKKHCKLENKEFFEFISEQYDPLYINYGKDIIKYYSLIYHDNGSISLTNFYSPIKIKGVDPNEVKKNILYYISEENLLNDGEYNVEIIHYEKDIYIIIVSYTFGSIEIIDDLTAMRDDICHCILNAIVFIHQEESM